MKRYDKELYDECKRKDSLYSIIQIMSAVDREIPSIIIDKKIAIYGIGMMGNALFCLLKKLNADIVYAIDRRGDESWNNLNVFLPDQELPYADLIVITVDAHYLEIQSTLISKGIAYMSINEFLEELINYPFEY